MPENSLEKSRGEVNAPSAAPPSMIVNSGAPETNATSSRTMRTVVISVPHPLALGAELAAHEVVDLDHDLHQRVEDDQRRADRDHGDGELLHRADVRLGDHLRAEEPARVQEQRRGED